MTAAAPGQMKLTETIIKLIATPSTVNELAALLEKPKATIHATLINLRNMGRAKVLSHRREHPKGGPSALWGRP